MTVKIHINQVNNIRNAYKTAYSKDCPLVHYVVAQCLAYFDTDEEVINAMAALSGEALTINEMYDAVPALTQAVYITGY